MLVNTLFGFLFVKALQIFSKYHGIIKSLWLWAIFTNVSFKRNTQRRKICMLRPVLYKSLILLTLCTCLLYHVFFLYIVYHMNTKLKWNSTESYEPSSCTRYNVRNTKKNIVKSTHVTLWYLFLCIAYLSDSQAYDLFFFLCYSLSKITRDKHGKLKETSFY